MEQFFTSLNKRQTMLLLTAATFGGQESIGIFEHLPDDEAELLKHRAEGLAKIPRDKRVPLLVQEIKRLVTARRGQLWSADPERLAQVLKGERSALVEVILRALPEGTADAVRKHLPAMAKVKIQREVRPQILHIVRWKLEEALGRAAPKRPGFKFSDVLLLKSREVLTLCDRLGARALGQPIAGLGEAERDSFLGRLKPDQRQLAAKAATAMAARALAPDDAAKLLAMYGSEKDPSMAVTSAGAQRLARASLAQSPEFAARLVERHPGALGQLLLKWVREERPRVTGKVDGGRTDVVAELEKLEEKGIIDKPVRLAPPPLKAPVSPPPRAPSVAVGAGELPGGKLLPPKPRGVVPSPPQGGAPGSKQSSAYRDPIAERQARRAGVPVPRADDAGARRDPIADRQARRAGALSSRALPPVQVEEAQRERPPGRPSERGSSVGPPPLPNRPRSQVLQPLPQRPNRPPSQVGVPVPPAAKRAGPPGEDLAKEHRAVGYDTAKRRNQADGSKQDPPTQPQKALQPGEQRGDRTSLQRAPRPPGRGPKDGSG